MSATGGVELKQIAQRSFLLQQVDSYKSPQAANTSKFVASVDPSSAATVGTPLTLQSGIAGNLLKFARRVTVTVTDDSVVAGSELSVTINVVGYRWGFLVTDTITATAVASGVAVTATGTTYFDEVVSCTPAVISNAAASDALLVGMDGTSFGLRCRIKRVNSVKSIINVSTVTEAAPVAISSTTVDVAQSAIKGITLATSDDWTIQYLRDGEDGLAEQGARA